MVIHVGFENNDNPYREKRNTIQVWESIASYICKSSDDILQKGKRIENLGIMPKDALHIACALKSGCECFITTDKKLLNKIIDGLKILNPIDFIKEMEE